MAKDFDFRRTTSSRAPQPNRPILTNNSSSQSDTSPEVVHKSKPDQQRISVKKVSWLVVVVIMGVFAVMLGLYYQSLQITPSNPRTTEESTDSTSTESQKQALVVDVFDGGAGTETQTSTLTILKDAGFTVKDAGKTQFEYDKTYIWYVTGFEADAEKIATLLSTRKTVLKESKVSGSFTIQIQLGKE